MAQHQSSSGVAAARRSPRLFLCAIVCFLGCGHKDASDPVWIGHVAALSGPEMASGDQARQAILLAVEEADDSDGRVAGRRVAVDHADTRGQKDMVRSVVVRLVSINRVRSLLGGQETAEVENVGAIAQAHGVPFVLAAACPPRSASEFVFYTGLTPEWQGQVLARYAVQELTRTNWVLVADRDVRRSALVDAFVRELPRDGLAGRWTYAAADKMPAVFEALRARKPAALLFAGSAADFAAFVQLGLDSQLPVLFAGDDTDLPTLRGLALRHTLYLATAFADDGRATTHDFIKKFHDRFGQAPEPCAALAYDNARLVFEAMRHAKSFDGAKIRESLRELRFDGLTGPLSFDQQQLARRAAFIVSLKDGQLRFVKRYDPEDSRRGQE